jgi:hypothetical protein
MARGMHRHRRIRLDNLRDTKIATRARKAPGKVKERARRDATIIAKITAAAAGLDHAPEVQSWLSRRTGRPYSRLSREDIAAAIA